MSEMVRLRLIVANLDRDDDILIAGAIEESLYEIIDYEETDKLIAKMKRDWAPDATEWRELLVDIPKEQLLAAFHSPVIEGEVVK